MATAVGPQYPSASVVTRMKTMRLPSSDHATCESEAHDDGVFSGTTGQPVSTGCVWPPFGSVRIQLVLVGVQQARPIRRPGQQTLPARAVGEEFVRATSVRSDDPKTGRRARRGLADDAAGSRLVDVADEGDQVAGPEGRGGRRRLGLGLRRRRVRRRPDGREQGVRWHGRHDRREAQQPATGGQRAAGDHDGGGGQEGDALAARRATEGRRCRRRDRRQALAQVIGRGLGRVDLVGVPRPQSLFQLSIGHRTVPLVSAASIASCRRLRA